MEHHPQTHYFNLWKEVTGLEAEVVATLDDYLVITNWRNDFYKKLVDIDVQNNLPVNFTAYIKEIRQLGLLIEKLEFGVLHLNFINGEKNGNENITDVFGLNSVLTTELLQLPAIEKLWTYHRWMKLDEAVVENILHPMLDEGRPSTGNKQYTVKAFSYYFGTPEQVTFDIFPAVFTITGVSMPIHQIDSMKDRALLCVRLGISGQQLKSFNNHPDYDKANELVNVITASFQAQYEEKEDFEKAFEPFEEMINELRRDILCDYILGRREVNFKDTNEMYGYFLVDSEMSGCMKTSKIIAATLSLQTYVQRTLLGLEQNEMKLYDANGDVTGMVTNFKAFLDPSIKEQWTWRKNYRVWEANRKVGVYPENYIEPEWRDNKSPEFKELEEELLQEKITMDSAEEAYKKYLKKFTQIGGLKITNISFEQKKIGESTYDIYHIFGRTYTDPYQYYYRKLKLHPADSNAAKPIRQKEWTPWEVIDRAIPSPYVSSVSYQGKLFVFWVQIVTLEENETFEGTTKFHRYKHQLRLFYSFKNFKGEWIEPQELSGFVPGHFDKTDYANNKFETSEIRYRAIPYTVLKTDSKGNQFEVLKIDYRRDTAFGAGHFQTYKIDLAKNILIDSNDSDNFLIANDRLELSNHQTGYFLEVSNAAITAADPGPILEWKSFKGTLDYGLPQDRVTGGFDKYFPNLDFRIVIEKEYDSLFSFANEKYLIRQTDANEYSKSLDSNNEVTHLKSDRITIPLCEESVIEEFNNILYNKDFSIFLTINTQEETTIDSIIPFDYPNYLLQPFNDPNKLNFHGTNGLYYKELFFHIPFLIADHLNAEGKYEEADSWFREIFDISAEPNRPLDNPIDRVWQYAEFRDQQFPKYSSSLTDPNFLSTLNIDPFNPHAIGRLRISAYQKAIVFKYVDNLLDWGDLLFRRFTMESVFEALMIYMLAQDVLGSRPQELCKCETGADDKLTYADIANSIEEGNDFLIWLENQQLVSTDITNQQSNGSDQSVGNAYLNSNLSNGNEIRQNAQNAGYTYTTADGRTIFVQNKTTKKPVFCVPMNKEALDSYDRVADRLHKIRHCMNIDGVKQKLSLFADPIDPRLLVAARASGLSIADAIAGLNAPVPNYRFSYMIEKAKSFAGTVQSFGGALLSALEKKDTEELTLLRSAQEQNILSLTSDIKKQQIEENKTQILNLEETKKNIQNRVDYYSGLIDVGLIDGEKVQQKLISEANRKEDAAGVLQLQASYAKLVAQLGAPTSLNYGGEEIGLAFGFGAGVLSTEAGVLHRMAAASGVEASNQRREQEWQQQLTLAEQELVAFNQQINAAQISLGIAEKDLEIHQNQIDQAKELFDFYKGKFTNLGTYNFMARAMNRLFNQAYNLALDMAKQTEKCYQFETNDLNYYIKNDNWDSGYAGLLAGERLTLQLQRLEKAYLEKNPRREEITQSFSLRMLQPQQLIQLQKNGKCNFTIPEWAFDIHYPGHYRRTIKSVRLTIPCVTGPYTNVSCRLTLTQNRIRTKPKLGADFFFVGPNSANGSITTSTANNDGGQFELNFNDARYLPFEGGGAAGSEWILELPNHYKSFDYHTISDAIIHISYTALYDNTLKSKIDVALSDSLNVLKDQEFARVISLKEEFPDELYQLVEVGTGNTSLLKLESYHFSYFLGSRNIEILSIHYFDESLSVNQNLVNFDAATRELSLEHDKLLDNGDLILLVKIKIV